MTVIPIDLNRVFPNSFAVEHLDCRLVHLEGAGGLIVGFLRLCTVGSGADGAGAIVPQKGQTEAAVEAVAPIDFNALGL